MLEALEYYQSLAQKFQGQFLTGLGILVVLMGLCIWLAGLRWRRIVGALAGAMIAGTGVLVISGSARVVLTACAIGLLAGVIINRIVFGIFGAIVGALIIMIILANKTYNTADNFTSYPTWSEYEIGSIPIPAPAVLEINVKMAEYFIGRAKIAIASAGIISFAGAGAAAVIAVLAVLMFPRLFIAVVSSALGSAVIFTGMIMLLFYKGSRPITYIADKPRFYAMAFGAMVIFGAIIQLILSPSVFARVSSAKPADKEKGEK
ncbi:MAG: hypothetical protein NTW93_00585 [Phycisphaerae bacterium]|nr:hypothetical protein [Phycisphaerae bacterium]